MKTIKVKNMLLTIAGLIGAPALAQKVPTTSNFKLVDELPVQYRAGIYSKIVEHLNQNPDFAIDIDHVLAVHESGAVLVLDKKWVKAEVLGAPSCIPELSAKTEGQADLKKKGVIYVFDGSLFNRGVLGAPSCIPE